MQVPLEVSVHLKYLFQNKGARGKELLKMYPKLSKATIYRHAKKLLADKTVAKRIMAEQEKFHHETSV